MKEDRLQKVDLKANSSQDLQNLIPSACRGNFLFRITGITEQYFTNNTCRRLNSITDYADYADYALTQITQIVQINILREYEFNLSRIAITLYTWVK